MLVHGRQQKNKNAAAVSGICDAMQLRARMRCERLNSLLDIEDPLLLGFSGEVFRPL